MDAVSVAVHSDAAVDVPMVVTPDEKVVADAVRIRIAAAGHAAVDTVDAVHLFDLLGVAAVIAALVIAAVFVAVFVAVLAAAATCATAAAAAPVTAVAAQVVSV